MKSVPQIVSAAMPAVVSITISKRLEEIEKELPHEYFPFFGGSEGQRQRATLKKMADSHGMIEVGGGSGFIVDSSGIVITNRHVIADPKSEYTILTNDNRKFGAEIIARDPINDVAILRLHSNDNIGRLNVLPLGSSLNVLLGEPIIAIGNSLGLFRNTVSAGIISGLSRSIRAQVDPTSPVQEMRGLIQTDAAINPGNSGGPLLNAAGRVIGINTAIVYGAQNIGFAIPIDAVHRDLEDLKKYGRIRKPLLGIRYLTIDENLKAKANLSSNHGALVISESPDSPGVIPGTPGAKAGIKERDIILECDGKPITTQYTIQDILSDKNADDILTLKLLRGNQTKTVKVKLSERK